jgi:cell division protease FtsH
MLNYVLFLAGAATGAAVVIAFVLARGKHAGSIDKLLKQHLAISRPEEAVIRDRKFPNRVSPDAKAAIDGWLADHARDVTMIGVPVTDVYFSEIGIGTLLAPREHAMLPSAVDFSSFDIGEEKPVECPRHALWLFKAGDARCAVFWTSSLQPGGGSIAEQLRISIACKQSEAADPIIENFLRDIEKSIQRSACFRGKILSFESGECYTGSSSGLKIHKLHHVNREDVILSESTLHVLDRNVLRFVEQRPALARLGMPTKKGLLFYGPPGTGKTHTLHYLIGALKGHTTLLVTAEQIGAVAEYLTLARLLQPSIVVIEDVDLVARDRSTTSVCEQSILNRLLNEMDGLREDAEILFLLTTNRPEELEAALAARPGRIDQAIEFPFPDLRGREKLVRLYSCGAQITEHVVSDTAKRTEGVSAAFVKELMRRAIQFHLECAPHTTVPKILQNDVDQAIDELLATGGVFNRKILGADSSPEWRPD